MSVCCCGDGRKGTAAAPGYGPGPRNAGRAWRGGAEREEFTSIAVVQTRAAWERYNREIVSALQLADAEFMQRMQAEGKYAFSFDADQMAPFYKPSLILTGRQDSMTGYRDAWKLLDLYPHASFAVLDHAGHNLHMEQEVLLEAMVKEWLNITRNSVIG